VPTTRVCLLVEQGPEPLWARLADFPNWRTWLTKVKDSAMAPGPTHSPGAVRVVGPTDKPRVHEVLVATDAKNLTVTYAVAKEPVWSVPARDYVAIVRLIPLTDRSATVVEWSSRYDCDLSEQQRIHHLFEGFYTEFIGNLASA
jgi:Polyketide cyclase / dehydrase and lipid transport